MLLGGFRGKWPQNHPKHDVELDGEDGKGIVVIRLTRMMVVGMRTVVTEEVGLLAGEAK